ncbi:hypothetical protein HHL16_07605 [Pseudoflavitalea sp. G-6-1-2]|uniref:hypothetical protein n=1 Tax=Pseudoflavitalea sp. G-6-1-2 TaxID=2728841 RepID=UPI00146D16D0|nr:hypothetical protein [Pseudoflavitalea sp. G-6-1-2]NML20734.1 hypothetical protein [Pseudoflavitalea sp. G-6-1-2]
MRLFPIASLLLIAAVSCSKPGTPEMSGDTLFSLDAKTKTWLLPVKLNDTWTFSSDKGNTRVYTVQHKTNYNTPDVQSMPEGAAKSFYRSEYETILLERTDAGRSSAYTEAIEMLFFAAPAHPMDSFNVIEPIRKGYPGRGYMKVTFFDYNGGVNSNILPAYNMEKLPAFSTFNSGTRNYTSVLKCASGYDKEVVLPVSSGGTIIQQKRAVNEVWYDKQFGIVYFADVHGEKWTRSN